MARKPRPPRTVQFWVDELGYVWVGPTSPVTGGLRYARFDGTFVKPDGVDTHRGMWIYYVREDSDPRDPDPDWEPISVERLQAFLRFHGCTDYGAGTPA